MKNYTPEELKSFTHEELETHIQFLYNRLDWWDRCYPGSKIFESDYKNETQPKDCEKLEFQNGASIQFRNYEHTAAAPPPRIEDDFNSLMARRYTADFHWPEEFLRGTTRYNNACGTIFINSW